MSTRLPSVDIGLKSVLVASDFTEASSKPLRHAISIARHFHARLYLTHVASSIGFTIAGADAIESVTEAAQRDLAGQSHEFVVRQGDVWEELKGASARSKPTWS